MTAILTPEALQSLLDGPARQPPSGVVPHFGDRSPALTPAIIDISITLTISFLAVLVRLLTQKFLANGVVLEDFVITLATVFQISAASIGVVCAQNGLGKHMWDMTLQNFIDMSKWTFIYAILYTVSIALIKCAILLQFIRIFTPSRVNRPTWVVCWSSIVVNISFYVILLLLLIFQCTPIEKAWNPLESGGHCSSRKAIYTSSAIFNMVSDFCILIIPIPIILRLNMNLKSKLAVLSIFAAGILACVASVMRFHYTWLLFKSPDASFYLWHQGLWCSIEQTTGILIFCLPTLRRLYNHLKPRAASCTTSSSGNPMISPSDPEKAPARIRIHTYDMPSLASFET